MKVAVCTSGLLESSGKGIPGLRRNDEIRRAKFPEADFYYATWKSQKDLFEKAFPGLACQYFDEPVMRYHPYKIRAEDVVSKIYPKWAAICGRPGRTAWSANHTKQILIHSFLLEIIKEDYELIVRTRFDAFISKKANFLPFMKDSLKNQRAHGFAMLDQKAFNKLLDSNPVDYPDCIWDQLIIHPPSLFDRAEVMRLHEQKTLHPSETGWFQVLSFLHGSNHVNHLGWVGIDRKVRQKFFY